MELDVLNPILDTIQSNTSITNDIADWKDTKSIHTRIPIPSKAPYPLITIGPVVSKTDIDGINDFRPVVIVDIAAFGEQEREFRLINLVAEKIHQLFHRQKSALIVDGYSVIEIIATGPIPAIGEDESYIGRRVSLTITLKKNN